MWFNRSICFILFSFWKIKFPLKSKTFEGDFRISQRNYLSKVERGTGTRYARRAWLNISWWYIYWKRCQLFFILEWIIPIFFCICPISIWMECEGIIRKLFVFRYFSSKKWWEFEWFIGFRELNISEYYSFIGSLVYIEFPHFPINMSIKVSQLMYFSMTNHHKKCNFVRNTPFVFITNIWIRFFRTLFHFKGECGWFFPSFNISNESHS